MQLSDSEWKQKLTPEQYNVLRQKGTEPPFSGAYATPDVGGVYHCVGCGAELFSTTKQYDSTTPGLMGWPSFADVIEQGTVVLQPDLSGSMKRVEAVCAICGSHLGHLFDDPSSPNGKHYCINSVALDFNPSSKGEV